MLAKLNFPREALVLSGIYQTLFNAGIKVALLIGALSLLGVNPGWNILLFPLGILSLDPGRHSRRFADHPSWHALHGCRPGDSSADAVPDVPLARGFSDAQGGLGRHTVQINPFTPIILSTRDWLTGFKPEFLGYFLAVNVVALALLLVVWVAYRLAMPILIERISA